MCRSVKEARKELKDRVRRLNSLMKRIGDEGSADEFDRVRVRALNTEIGVIEK